MKQGIVKFSKEFKTITGNVWLGIENEYDMNSEDPLVVFKRAEESINQYATSIGLMVYFDSRGMPENSPPPGPPPVINVQRTSEDIRIAELVRDIYACTQLDGDNGLWSYSKLATTCKEAELAYEVMKKKITKADKIIKDTIKYGNA